MRRDGGNHGLDTLHHGREVDRRRNALEAKAAGVTHLLRHPGAFDQGLARHAAVVQAIAAHDVGFHQRHPGLDGGGDIRRHQPAGTGADDDQVAVKAPGPLAVPARIHAAPLQRLHHRLGQQRKQAQQRQCAEQSRAGHVAQGGNAGQLGTGVDIHRRTDQHAELADPVKSPGAQRGQAHGQVDDKKRHHRDQAQAEQIQRAVARHPLVDAGQPLAKARLHRVTQHKARGQKRHRGAQRGGERHQQQAPAQPEHAAAGQRQDGGAGQRQGSHRHVQGKVDAAHGPGRLGIQRGKTGLAGLQVGQADKATQIQRDKAGHRQRQRAQHQQAAARHDKAFQPHQRRVTMVMAHRAAKP